MELFDIFYLLILGTATGVLSGLLGFGGGVFVVPCLYIFFHLKGFSGDQIMQLAIGTSLATMIATSIVATWSHQRKKSVLWKITKKLIPSIAIGSILGVLLAKYLPSAFLAQIFGIFMLLLSIYILFSAIHTTDIPSPSHIILHFCGSVIGFLSSLLGIGGGTISVPLFVTLKIPLKNAIATSSSLTVITAFIGTIGYCIAGWGESFPRSFSFFYIPGFLIMSLMTTLTAPFGVKLAYFLPIKVLKLICAFVLICIALAMIFIP